MRCSLTHNFDRDRQWGFCAPDKTQPDEKCYETIHLRYYDIGESWGRIHLRNVEQCTCVAGEIECERVRYTMCRTNPCQNDGTCRLITASGKEVCNCRHSNSGPDCSYGRNYWIIGFTFSDRLHSVRHQSS
ncbi:hypothetical protein F2P81_018321 [Scophthalmus maximus]|uniref:EGF-like domain-containing protein n=1 Tax=Scophthalmus maximus TaxID=52904 RepID=A0A6A4S1X5_SCOMX|nr:hypothetical protein F2P81_018321 [Scophthalmus maximus]